MAKYKRKNNITQGSLARKMETHSTRDYDESIESIPAIKEIRSKQYKREKKTGMLLRVGVLFAVALLVIFRYARITELGYEYNEYYSQYEELKSDNNTMTAEIEKSINLEAVRKVAEEDLNMHKPEEYQIVQIDVSKPDMTEVTEIQEEEKGTFDKIVDWVKGLLSFLE